jgi:hypothetical protein
MISTPMEVAKWDGRRTLIYPVPLGDRFAVPLPYGPEALVGQGSCTSTSRRPFVPSGYDVQRIAGWS